VAAGTLSGLRSSRMVVAGTGLRILLAPAAVALLLGGSDIAAAVVFAVAAVTDWFDGMLARRWGVTTRFGAFLDTTADKLLVSTALIALVAIDRASPWIAIVIIAREFTILGLRTAVASHGHEFATSMLGKWKATAQFGAITLAMVRPDVLIGDEYLDEWVLLAAAIVTFWSGVDYLGRFASALRSS